jgi:conjugal transfer mating pair stabilization protein TraG
MIWEIYAYWNINELRGVFEAIAMLTNSADYSTLIASMMVFGVGAVTLGILGGNADLMQAWKWFVLSIFFYFIMFIPKTDVALVDRTGTVPATTVSNVPLSIALFGHFTSKLGDWMATSYDTAMGVISPTYLSNEMQFTGQGLMFGQKIIMDAQALQPQSVAFKMNMSTFMEKCVFPEFDTGHIHPADVVSTNDLWATVSNVNPSLYITLVNADGTPAASPVDCQTAYNSVLTPLLNNEANGVLGDIAHKVYPQKPDALARVAMDASLANSYNFMFGVSESATDIIKQRLMANVYLNTSALSSKDIYAKTQAEVLASQQYSTLSQIAQSTIPKLRNVIEVVLYAVFPIILVMIIIGGSKGLMVVKSYLIGLLWIQLWAPLYAVMNYLMTSYRQTEWLAQVQPTSALNVLNSNMIQAGSQSDMDIAGMLAISIPMLAYALVKGGEMAMTSFVSGAIAPAQQSASRASSDVAMGNLSQGNVSANNKSFESLSALNYNMTPSATTAAANYTHQDGIKHTYTSDGAHATDSTGRESKGALNNYTASASETRRLSDELTNQQAQTKQYQQEAVSTATEASSIINGQSTGFEASRAAGLASTVTDKSAAEKGFKTAMAAQESLEHDDKFSKSDAAKINAYAQSELATGAKIEAIWTSGWTAKAGVKLDKEGAAKAEETMKEAYKNTTQTEASEGLKLQQELASSQTLRGEAGVSASTEDKIQAQTSHQAQLSEKISASRKEEESLSHKLENSQDRTDQYAMNLAAAIGVNYLGEAAEKWFSGEGVKTMDQYYALKQQGRNAEAEALAGQVRSHVADINSQHSQAAQAFMPSDIPKVNAKEAEERIQGQYAKDTGEVQAVHETNKEKTGADGVRGTVAATKAGLSTTIDGMQDNQQANAQYEKDNQELMVKPDVTPKPYDLETPPKSTIEAAGKAITAKADANPNGEHVKGVTEDINTSLTKDERILASAKDTPVGYRSGEQVAAILTDKGYYQDNPASNWFQDTVNKDGIKQMYANGEITKDELKRFETEYSGLDNSQKVPMQNLRNSLPDQLQAQPVAAQSAQQQPEVNQTPQAQPVAQDNKDSPFRFEAPDFKGQPKAEVKEYNPTGNAVNQQQSQKEVDSNFPKPQN